MGVEYNTKLAACRAGPISTDAVWRYTKNNSCSFQDALDYYSNGCTKYTVLGKVYSSVCKACLDLGIKPNCVYEYKKYYGVTTQEALDHYAYKMNHPDVYVVRGVEYSSKRSACDAVPVCRSTVNYYARTNKCSYQEALDYYISNVDTKTHNVQKYIVRGITYDSKRKACEAVPTTISHVSYYMNKLNCSFQEGLNHCIEVIDNKTVYTVFGKSYKTKSEACRAIPVSLSAIFYYSNKYKCSFQEALDYYVESHTV